MNNMKNFIIRSSGLLLVFLTLAFIPSCFTQQPMESGNEATHARETASNTLEANILEHINNYRTSKGLSSLKVIPAMSEQATKHSADMAAKKVPFSHDGFEERVKSISKQIGALKSSAENVAYGKLSAKEVVDVWLKSPGHRKNIEGKYTLTGIGIAEAKNGTIFFTQLFASN